MQALPEASWKGSVGMAYSKQPKLVSSPLPCVSVPRGRAVHWAMPMLRDLIYGIF